MEGQIETSDIHFQRNYFTILYDKTSQDADCFRDSMVLFPLYYSSKIEVYRVLRSHAFYVIVNIGAIYRCQHFHECSKIYAGGGEGLGMLFYKIIVGILGFKIN